MKISNFNGHYDVKHKQIEFTCCLEKTFSNNVTRNLKKVNSKMLKSSSLQIIKYVIGTVDHVPTNFYRFSILKGLNSFSTLTIYFSSADNEINSHQ